MRILVATYGEGLFLFGASGASRELEGESILALASDGAGALAIVNGTSLRRRSTEGRWTTLAEGVSGLSGCAVAGNSIFVGTNDARVFRVQADGTLSPRPAFQTVQGRETWYAGNTIIGGRVVGPPLGVRSMCASCDGSTLLVNVHVGGIPRSTDSGQTWKPTIEVASDVHQVSAHPDRPQLVGAATALGLALSTDAGQSWTIDHEGLHATHCLAAAFVGDEVWVSASPDPFSDGAVYRRPIDGSRPLQRLSGGVLPQSFERGVDTGNIAANGDVVAIADRAGHLYVSRDRGTKWELLSMVPGPSGVLVLPGGS